MQVQIHQISHCLKFYSWQPPVSLHQRSSFRSRSFNSHAASTRNGITDSSAVSAPFSRLGRRKVLLVLKNKVLRTTPDCRSRRRRKRSQVEPSASPWIPESAPPSLPSGTADPPQNTHRHRHFASPPPRFPRGLYRKFLFRCPAKTTVCRRPAFTSGAKLLQNPFILRHNQQFPVLMPSGNLGQPVQQMAVHRLSIQRIEQLIFPEPSAVPGCQIKYRYSHSFSAIPIAICSLVIGSSRNHRPVAL